MAILTRPERKGKDAAQARLIKLIEQQLGIVRCADCGRPLRNLRSIVLGRGPRCWAKREGRS
jgi:hypothetical protein